MYENKARALASTCTLSWLLSIQLMRDAHRRIIWDRMKNMLRTLIIWCRELCVYNFVLKFLAVNCWLLSFSLAIYNFWFPFYIHTHFDGTFFIFVSLRALIFFPICFNFLNAFKQPQIEDHVKQTKQWAHFKSQDFMLKMKNFLKNFINQVWADRARTVLVLERIYADVFWRKE